MKTLFYYTTLLLLISLHTVFAQEEVLLWPEGAPGALGSTPKDKPSLMIYQAPKDSATGAAVLVCPGGGYANLAIDHEGHAIARWFNSMGITAFVLKYRLGSPQAEGYHHPIQLNDAKRAMRMIRHQAGTYGINPDQIGVIGFSAGGHLASTLGTHYDSGITDADNAIDQTNSRPNFMILVYPVISLNSKFTHRGSRLHLLGPNPAKALVDSLSNESQINSMTPPTFLVHSSDDTVVPPENSIHFYLKLQEHKVPTEMHIFEYGGHGYGMAPDDRTLNAWTILCWDWLSRMKLTNRIK